MWLSFIAAGLCTFLYNPAAFTATQLAAFFSEFASAIWPVYIAFSILRGLTLLPSTPLLVAGTIIFPEHPWAVLAVSMLGITISSTIIYYLSDYLGFSVYFEKHNPTVTHKIKRRLEHPLGFMFVAGWAFFPFVPTDLVCYLAGTIRMNFSKFISATFAGELVLCICYIFLGGSLLKLVW